VTQGLLNIAALSQRTGIAPDTLRKWEARYGVLHPARSKGGQRRYSERDVARVEWLRDRLREGWRIGEAARLLVATSDATVAEPAALRDALATAVTVGDSVRVGALLDQAFALLPLDEALNGVVTPTMRWVGDEWHAGRLSVAVEHAVTSRVRSRLEQLMADERAEVRGVCVLACAPDEQHDLGLLTLAVALRADGWRVEYLGADTPVADALAYAEEIGARVVCFSASRAETLATLAGGLRGLTEPPPVAVVVGGAAVRAADARALGAHHAPVGLTDAVDRLRGLAT
jgi:methanogenic corrinoid protein MtbC1